MDKEKTHQGSHDLLLGQEATKEQEEFTSIEKNVTTYVWCGDDDTTVHPDNSIMLAEALEKAGVPVKFELFPDVVHGVGLAEGWMNNKLIFG